MRGGFGTDTRYKLEILHQFVERVKTKSQNIWGLIPTFVEVTGEKMVGVGGGGGGVGVLIELNR